MQVERLVEQMVILNHNLRATTSEVTKRRQREEKKQEGTDCKKVKKRSEAEIATLHDTFGDGKPSMRACREFLKMNQQKGLYVCRNGKDIQEKLGKMNKKT